MMILSITTIINIIDHCYHHRPTSSSSVLYNQRHHRYHHHHHHYNRPWLTHPLRDAVVSSPSLSSIAIASQCSGHVAIGKRYRWWWWWRQWQRYYKVVAMTIIIYHCITSIGYALLLNYEWSEYIVNSISYHVTSCYHHPIIIKFLYFCCSRTQWMPKTRPSSISPKWYMMIA